MTIAAHIAGQVVSVPFVEGDLVTEGDLIVQLNDLAARADYQAAQKAADAAELKAPTMSTLVTLSERWR